MNPDGTSPDPWGSWPARFDREDFEGPPVDVGGRASHREYLQRTFNNLDFLVRYPLAVLRAKHRETLLGLGWEVLNPALLVLVWWIIREVVFPTTGGTKYLEFLVVSVFTFQYLQRFVVSGQAAVNSSKGLLQSFDFPPLVAVVQQSVTTFVSNAFSVGVLFVFLLLMGEKPRLLWLLFPLVLAMQSVFAMGGSMVLARVTTQNPDARNLVPFTFRLLFYGSGVIFPIEDRIAGSALRPIFELNPFYAITALTRAVILDSSITATTLTSAVIWSLTLPVIGYLIFRTGDDRYAV
jgi:teichoic acid transport system permease protein